MAEIYRKSVLEKLSSPDQLDRMIVITPPTFWLSMLGVAGIIVVALVWSILGRLPVNVSGNGILVSSDGMYSIYSEAQGVLEEISVAEGDTITKGQVLATIADKDTRAALKVLEDRIAIVEAVTLLSRNDVMNADTQSILEIKNSISTSDASALQSQKTLSLYQSQLGSERAYLNDLAEDLERAKSEYYNSLKTNTGGTDLTVTYTNAEQAYQAAVAEFETAGKAYEDAAVAWKNAEIELNRCTTNANNAKTEMDSRQTKYESAVNAVNTAEEAVRTAQNNLETAKGNLSIAEQKLADCGYAESDPQRVPFEQAVINAEAEVGNATEALNRANAALADANTAHLPTIQEYNTYKANYDSAVVELAAAQEAYNNRDNVLRDAETVYDDAETKYKASKQAYEKAKKEYDDYQSKSGGINADASVKGAVYQDLLSKYSTQQSIVSGLEQSVLSARAQMNTEGAMANVQAINLGNQFETTKGAVLSQLRAELEQAERALNKTYITSSRDGVVVELPVSTGTLVGQGAEIVKISGVRSADMEKNNVIVCYVPLSSGKKIREGMTVMVYPTTVNKQEYGHMEATVLSVDNYVTSNAEMRNQLGDDLLVQSFTQEGPVLAVTCELRTDNSTASGFYWSSAKAKDILVVEGTLVSVDIVTDRKAPITMLIPFLKEKLSMEGRMG